MNDNIQLEKLQQVLEPGGKKLGLTLDQLGTILYHALGQQAETTSTLSKSCVMAFEEFDRNELEPVVNDLGLSWDVFMEQVNLGRDLTNRVHRLAGEWKEWSED